jgi:hypothetical protein
MLHKTAPDMLKALTAFVDHYSGKEYQLGNGYAFQWFSLAKELIAKASQ